MYVMLTRSTARALLANRARGDKLPENVLLEIFDAYRRDIELQPGYKTVWNSRNGWFKLAHVCQRWRRVVLLSPSRLDVHLLFTLRRSSRVTMLSQLPPFPILIDYCAEFWTVKQENLALAAIRHRSRVRGIVLRRSYADMGRLLRALSHPFPGLKSLEICPLDEIGPSYESDHEPELILPATFLSSSALCLRQLTLRDVVPGCLSPLLSSATGLVELALTLRIAYSAPPESSFIENLQRLSCLRRLELVLEHGFDDRDQDPPLPPASAGDIVPLSKLAHLIFKGHRLYLQALVVVLAAPSLQHLDAELCGETDTLHFFPIPHLCKFICDTECQFTAVRLTLACWDLGFCAGMGSQSVDDQPFRITIPVPVSLEKLGQELSGPLSTVEELSIARDIEPWFESDDDFVITDELCGFYYHVPQVKILRISARGALEVAHSFQQDDQKPLVDLLPALERVEVLSEVDIRDVESHSIRVCDAFKPLIAAREQVGRPINLSWVI
ncbi:hypothetical protein BJY52DRAFT_1389413 [Lactarius psammicola]|nr:hypothetical protein BJY52DRAFT_1389413 [Lactarius psammicola]